MFSITGKTCRAFTLAEILIMAAMNVETIRLASATRSSLMAHQRRTNRRSYGSRDC
jgi:hypothetical protein